MSGQYHIVSLLWFTDYLWFSPILQPSVSKWLLNIWANGGCFVAITDINPSETHRHTHTHTHTHTCTCTHNKHASTQSQALHPRGNNIGWRQQKTNRHVMGVCGRSSIISFYHGGTTGEKKNPRNTNQKTPTCERTGLQVNRMLPVLFTLLFIKNNSFINTI